MFKHLLEFLLCSHNVDYKDTGPALFSNSGDRFRFNEDCYLMLTRARVSQFARSSQGVLIFASGLVEDFPVARGSGGARPSLVRATPIYCNAAAARILRSAFSEDFELGNAELDACQDRLLAALPRALDEPFLRRIEGLLQVLSAGAKSPGGGGAAVSRALNALQLATPFHVQLTVGRAPSRSPPSAREAVAQAAPAPCHHHRLRVTRLEAALYERNPGSCPSLFGPSASGDDSPSSLPRRQPKRLGFWRRRLSRSQRTSSCSNSANVGGEISRQEGGVLHKTLADRGGSTGAAGSLCAAIVVTFDDKGQLGAAADAVGAASSAAASDGGDAPSAVSLPAHNGKRGAASGLMGAAAAALSAGEERVSIQGSVSASVAALLTQSSTSHGQRGLGSAPLSSATETGGNAHPGGRGASWKRHPAGLKPGNAGGASNAQTSEVTGASAAGKGLQLDVSWTEAPSVAPRIPSAPVRAAWERPAVLRKTASAATLGRLGVQAAGATAAASPPGSDALSGSCEQLQNRHHLHMVKEGGVSSSSSWLRASMVLSALEPIVTAFTPCGTAVFYQNAMSIAYYGGRPIRPVSRAAAQAQITVGAALDAGAAIGVSGLSQLFALEPAKLERMVSEVYTEGRVWKGIIQAPPSCVPAGPPVSPLPTAAAAVHPGPAEVIATITLPAHAAGATATLPAVATSATAVAVARPSPTDARRPGSTAQLKTPASMSTLLCANPFENIMPEAAADSMPAELMDTAASMPESSRAQASTSVLDVDPLATSTWGLIMEDSETRGCARPVRQRSQLHVRLDEALACEDGAPESGYGDGLHSTSDNAQSILTARTTPTSSFIFRSSSRPHLTGPPPVLLAPRLPSGTSTRRSSGSLQLQHQQATPARQQPPRAGPGSVPSSILTPHYLGVRTGSTSSASCGGTLARAPSSSLTCKAAGRATTVAGGPGGDEVEVVLRTTSATSGQKRVLVAGQAEGFTAIVTGGEDSRGDSMAADWHHSPPARARRSSRVLTFASSLRNTPAALQQAVAGTGIGGAGAPGAIGDGTCDFTSGTTFSTRARCVSSAAAAWPALQAVSVASSSANPNPILTVAGSNFTSGTPVAGATTAVSLTAAARVQGSGRIILPTRVSPPRCSSSSSNFGMAAGFNIIPEPRWRAMPSRCHSQVLQVIPDTSTDTMAREQSAPPTAPADDTVGAAGAAAAAGGSCGYRPASAEPPATASSIGTDGLGGQAADLSGALAPPPASRTVHSWCFQRLKSKDMPGGPAVGARVRAGVEMASATRTLSGPETRFPCWLKPSSGFCGPAIAGGSGGSAGPLRPPSGWTGLQAKQLRRSEMVTVRLSSATPAAVAASGGHGDASSTTALSSDCRMPSNSTCTDPTAELGASSRSNLFGSAPVQFQEQGQQAVQHQQQQAAGPVWHEVTATRAVDPVTGDVAIVVTQTDVTAKVLAERHLALVAEAEHCLLEQIFPRHVLAHMAEEGVLLRPPLPRPRVSGSGCPRPRGLRDVSKLATSHSEVTLLFADIQGFTPMCQTLEPNIVMNFLNDLFTRFDRRLEEFGVYKVETIGDCYFVAGGLIEEDEHGMPAVRARESSHDPLHAERVLMFAKAMLAVAAEVRLPTTGAPVKMRIGIHSGPVVSGLVGERMPRFCLFGDTVNTASRMESTGVPGAIHASEAARRLLRNEDWVPTGGIEVKGKGRMETFLWLPADKSEAAEVRSMAGSLGSESRHRHHRQRSGCPVVGRRTRIATRGSSGASKASDAAAGDQTGCAAAQTDDGTVSAAAAAGAGDAGGGGGTDGFQSSGGGGGSGGTGTDLSYTRASLRRSSTYGSMERSVREMNESVQGLAMLLLGDRAM